MQGMWRGAKADRMAAKKADGVAAKRLELLRDLKRRFKIVKQELVDTEGKLEEDLKLRQKLLCKRPR